MTRMSGVCRKAFLTSLAAIALQAGVSLAAQSPKISPQLAKKMAAKGKAQRSFPVLISVDSKADLSQAEKIADRTQRIQYVYDQLRQHAQASQKDLLAHLAAKGLEAKPFYIANVIAVAAAGRSDIEELAERRDVVRLQTNDSFRAKGMPGPQKDDLGSQKTAAEEANLKETGAPKVWETYRAYGEGIVVAGQDTGVQFDHPALVNQYRGKTASGFNHDYNWHDAIKKSIGGSSSCGYDNKAPCDDHGHGTHTLGTVVGDDGRGKQIGMAPKARWIACRNMDDGIGRPETYIDCFQFFLAPYPVSGNAMTDGKAEYAPHVINNSWGCPTDEGCEGGEFLDVLTALKAAGIVVVASAGNDGPGCDTIKTGTAFHSDLTISVGAYDHRSGSIASFSSRGPSTFDNKVGPSLVAPGVSILSSTPGGKYQSLMWSGTSMAGPHVTGAVALLWSANKTLIGDFEKTKTLLTASAKAKTSSQNCGNVAGSAVPNNTYGYGAMNVFAAVQKSLNQ